MSSSSQDEIIEILNSSSSDNDFLKSAEPAFVHDAISISPKTTSNSIAAKASSLSSLKSNKRYQSKFKKEWLSNSDFSTFLRECKADPTKALCIICNVQFSIQNSGIDDIKHHRKQRSINNAQNLLKQIHVRLTARVLFKSFLAKRLDAAYNITTTELNRLSAVEGAMVFHSVKHSHSYISQACTINMIKKCFPDSSTTKNLTCGIMKSRKVLVSIRQTKSLDLS